MLEKAIPTINDVSTKLDQALNIITACPVIGGLGAVARIKYGNVQNVAGIAIALFASLATCCSKGETRTQWKKVAVFGCEHAIHGALNVLKGVGEGILAVCTYTLGNPVLLIFRIPDNFKPTFQYGEFSQYYRP